jgi:histidine triad (HIT) family protein
LNCIFCKIISGEIASELVADTPEFIAIRDISPQAPVHLLVIPKRHSENVTELTDQELGALMTGVRELVNTHTNGQFKLQFNTGAESGQTVFHTHAHILSKSAA